MTTEWLVTTGLWDQTRKFVHWNGIPIGNAFPMGQYYITELSPLETVDEQEIKNLLNENSDSEYECQNDYKL